MRNYRMKKNYADNTKHIVYYIHTQEDIPCSLGWNVNELREFAMAGRQLSIYVGLDK